MNVGQETSSLVRVTQLSVLQGDITKVVADAIVNAANANLMPGGGVDGAIHRAGGPSICTECQAIISSRGPLDTGEAVITGAGLLPARHVIHTVGPIWGRLHPAEANRLLASCYENSLDVAAASGCRTVAFPSISTGVYGYPYAPAAKTAMTAVARWARGKTDRVDEVTFVCYDSENFEIYRAGLAAMPST